MEITEQKYNAVMDEYSPDESVATTVARFHTLGLRGNAAVFAAQQQRGDLFDEDARKLYEYEPINEI